MKLPHNRLAWQRRNRQEHYRVLTNPSNVAKLFLSPNSSHLNLFGSVMALLPVTTQIGAKFVMQGYHQHRLIILGLNQGFDREESASSAASKWSPALIKNGADFGCHPHRCHAPP
ncbi:MAG: hypothetical protein GX564_07410 [Oligosphaeraceae bacterium]|nr:hypothetical protein [Oligosphaeraceae bacterium]